MADLPIGFRFYPTEEELVSFYLRMKLQGRRLPELSRVIPDVDIYDLEPWHLPKLAGEVCRSDTEQWFFFTPRQEREARGGRPSRTTGSGYWKATGSPSYVYSSDNRVIGVQKTMVFYNGKAPAGKKTKWKMHEYRAIEVEEVTTSDLNTTTTAVPKLRHEFSLSRVFVVSGSFRAFDRRPLGTATRKDTNRQPAAATSAAAAAAQIMEKTTSSPESSFSGGSGGEGAEAPPHDFQWDWEQLDWVCPSESRGPNPEEIGTSDENSFVFGG